MELDELVLHLSHRGDFQQLKELFEAQTDTQRINLDCRHPETKAGPIAQCIRGAKERHDEELDKYIKTIRLLIEKGTDVDVRDIHERTALHWALHYNNETIVKELVHQGADVKAEEVEGYTPLFLALRYGALESIHALVKASPEKVGINEWEQALQIQFRISFKCCVSLKLPQELHRLSVSFVKCLVFRMIYLVCYMVNLSLRHVAVGKLY